MRLRMVLSEYGRVVNGFIGLFWDGVTPEKGKLLKPIVDAVPSWFTARLRKMAARAAIDMIRASRERDGDKAKKPLHRGTRMCVSVTTAELQEPKAASGFDRWLHLSCIGNGLILDIPIKFHRHFNRLASKGTRQNAYVITTDSVQFSFEIETGPKLNPVRQIGIDTGINALASLSTGEQIGTDISGCIDRIKRCGHGSKGQRRASRALRQRMDEVAKAVVMQADLVVVENLKSITKNTRRRLVKSMRRSIGRWNVSYWLERLKQVCEWNRVSFRTVSPYKTSQICASCGYTDRMNRHGEVFRCLACGHEDNADVNAARNILTRFITGAYGPGYKAAEVGVS